MQVIVYTESRPGAAGGRGPGHLSADHRAASVPKSQVVRGFSFFGVSFVYVIFEDGTDHLLGPLARARVSQLGRRAPAGRRDTEPRTRRDRRGLGLSVRRAGRKDRPRRTANHPGLVRPLRPRQGGGRRRGRERRRLRQAVQRGRRSTTAAGARHPAAKICEAHRVSNMDVGGRTVEMAETEFIGTRPRLYQGRPTSSRSSSRPTAASRCCSRTSPASSSAPDERRGITEMNGEGEVARGIVAAAFGAERTRRDRQRQGADRRDRASLPQGVSIDAVYDRSELIIAPSTRSRRTLIEESVIVALVCILFLLHVRSALVAIITLPVGILIAFVAMQLLGLELQHHEPRRHRHRHRRHGRRGDRHDRERPQAPGAGAARTSRAPRS